MKNRVLNAIKIGYWAFKNPQSIQPSNLKMLSDLLALILKVASEGKHMMTRIAYIHPDTKTENEIVSIWCGAGIGSSPQKRIEELLKENNLLKVKLAERISNEQTIVK